MNERPLIRHWGSPWKFFAGEWKSPWETRLFEISSGREAEGGGAVVLLKGDEHGPFHIVEAAFALMGVWWRGSGQGWVDSEGRPATPPLEKQRAAFDGVKASILSTNPKDRSIFEIRNDARSAQVFGMIDFLSEGGVRKTENSLFVRRFERTGSFLVDGKPFDTPELEIPFGRTEKELVVYDYWNRRMAVSRFGDLWILAEWCTWA